MAMPPKGASPWFHHNDDWLLLDEAPFALVSRELATGRVSIGLSRDGSRWHFGSLVTFAPTPTNVRLELAGRPADRSVAWPEPGAVSEKLRATDAGAIELIDDRGRVRVVVTKQGNQVSLEFPTHPGTRVEQSKSSQP